MAEEKVQRLSEGYDFIEESSAFSDEALSFQDASELVISESESEKSPYKILGKACGCFAPIGEFSRNKRLYSNDLWPTVLANEEFSNRLNSRSIFGCISHSDKKVDDVDIREGKVSHIVTKLEIREDDNRKPYLYGELEILDTPAGRILEAMYKGGANLYVSSRGAGKLIPVPGKDYAMVRPDSYFVECFDVVCRPGFLKAKPVYEGIKESEEVIDETSTDLKNKVAALRQINAENANAGMEDAYVKYGKDSKEFKEASKKTNDAIAKLNKHDRHSSDIIKSKEYQELGGMYEAPGVPRKKTNESEEIQALQSQISKLTKIIEKVVDDVYETEEKSELEESIEEQLGNLLNNSNISEEAYEDVVAILHNAKPELLNKIMENSRHKFNDEHAEKTGQKISYYRFGGNKPYKIIPKDKSYFEASWDAPRYRSLKQAQKHILDLYNKPKEETNEALTEAVSLLVNSNLSKPALEDIIDTLLKAKKQ